MANKDPSKAFHDKVRNLLRKAGLTIERSSYYGEGPDIVASAENQRVIVQCKCAETPGKPYVGLEHLIDEYSTKVKKEGAQVAILALGNYKIPENYQDPNEKKRVLKEDRVVVWDDRAISYYARSVNALGSYAKYALFGDLGIKKRFAPALVVPALEVKQNGHKFFFFTMSPEKLLKIAYVFRREYSPDAYQRMLNPTRLRKEIAKEFLDKPDAILPNVIVCAFESGVQFDKNSNKLTIPMKYASVWIIDGQHRLYAFCHVEHADRRKRFTLPCVGFNVEGIPGSLLTEAQQGKIFVNINEEARRIEPLLLLDLYEQIGVKDRRVEIVKDLAKTNIFKDKIQFPRTPKRQIALPTFARTAPMKKLVDDHGTISEWYGKRGERKKVPQQYCYTILRKYFSIVSKVFAKEWKRPETYILATNRGIRGLLRILEWVLKYSDGLRDSGKAKACISALRGFEFRNSALKGMYLGEGGAEKLAEEWIAEIQKKIPAFGPQAKVDEKLVMPGEKDLAESFIKSQLSKFEGEVIGELMHIDKSTFHYLDFIPSSCGIKLIVRGVKQPMACYEEARKTAQLRSYLAIVKIRYLEQPQRAFLHERWLADKNYKVDFGTDLKDDALGKSKHTIAVRDKPWLSESYVKFTELWKADPAELGKRFGAKLEKQEFFSSE